MRDRDRQEIGETRTLDPDQIAIDAYASPWRWVAYDDNNLPALVIGAKPAHAGVCTVWGYGTRSYRDCIVEMTKHLQTDMVPALLNAGFHRAQCLVHPDNVSSQKWLEKLGFKAEATLRGFGSSRTDMLLFAWVVDEPKNSDP